MVPTSPTYSNGHISNEEELPHSAPIFRPTGRRTPSFSSSSSGSWDSFRSSSFSYSEDFPPFSPTTTLKFKGVPFSWEQIPGIPKHQGSKKKDSSGHLLPLPPAGTTSAAATTSSAKKLLHQEEISPKKSNRFQKDDPFFAALLECSKDGGGVDDEHGSNSGDILKGASKMTRSLSDRFGLINMYTSCKRTCAVSESIVNLPRQTSHYLLNRPSS